MILTLLRIGWLNLKRDRVAQAMTFVLPILFFSIFATVFGNQRNPTRRITVAVVDEDQSDYSKKLVNALQAEGGLAIETSEKGSGRSLDRTRAEAMVKGGTVPIAIVLPKGLGDSPRFFATPEAKRVAVQLLADVSDPVAPQMVQGLLQKVSFTAAPEALATQGMQQFERYSGPLTPAQRASFEAWLSRPPEAAPASASTNAIGLPIDLVNVMQPSAAANGATVSFYAAGIGVMTDRHQRLAVRRP